MPTILEVRKTYKYRLYTSKQDVRLHNQIDIAGLIWNHVTRLQKRYYRLFGKHISTKRVQKHIAKLRMRTEKYGYWRKLGSQTVQEICQRNEKAYERFFNKQGGLPRIKPVRKFRSFVLKQAGWQLEDVLKGKKYRRITIGETKYKFVYHRPMSGTIKTVTIKRDAAQRLWICFSVMEKIGIEDAASAGHIGGFDFGLTTFLTTDSGDKIDAPQFFKQDLPRLKHIQRRVSKKVKGSTNRREGYKHLARCQIRIADKRLDFHYQLAHDLCDSYDVLVFENLNIAGMKKLWGRKVSDLGFSQFLTIVEQVAFKRGKRFIQIGRWDRTTGKCSACGHVQAMALQDRIFCCQNPACGLVLERDHNAAINIRELGHQLILSQSVEDLWQYTGIRRLRQKPTH
jgi:putative transposase